MSDDNPKWSSTMMSVGATLGAIIGYVLFTNLLEVPEADPGEVFGRTTAGTIIGILLGTPLGGAIGFGFGKVLEKLNIKH
ncbi:hypothetical protein [Hyphomonas sp.]|uniref:hypothetical protein n=1 Tax=Hyphomonas sp. TaxID=87 RepID=UPI000C5333E0|nr:hypothetical protein [Hyphomonas sp.]MAB11342.1 hypothetical protein [Hyphomonas sp.]MAU65745.1 hypothetical protein [Hyphomonas sp.]MBM58324.1 hypothetical protein [Hyphomonas sp.]|tara:strand:+ start:347 stop:586 length:240 start_codon:yes stop_codon:yes gene_type:complete